MSTPKHETYYVGLATTNHDTALALVDSQGEVLFAEATERPMQFKGGGDCIPDNREVVPKIVKNYCDPNGEFVIARTWSTEIHDVLRKQYLSGEIYFKETKNLHEEILKCAALEDDAWLLPLKLFNMLNIAGQNFKGFLDSKYRNNKVRMLNYCHHHTHAANACYTSPFEEGACMIVDGYGEFGAISYYHYKDGKVSLVKELKGIESLGMLYSICTKLCGFDPGKDEEWKVMGLAPYGKLDTAIYQSFKKLIDVDGCAIKYSSRQNLEDWITLLISKMPPEDASSYAAADMAYTAQYVYTEVMIELLNNFYQLGLSENLILGGGCGLNSSFNGQVVQSTQFKRLHVPSAPGDDGNALGAALLAYHEDHPEARRKPKVQLPYLGSRISKEKLDHLKAFSNIEKMRYLPETIHKEAAALLAEGKLIGWVQGRAEFGPRALGNRSILADPRPANMKDKINSLVKFREEFRPFAPAVLHEFGDEYFEHYQESPYMERTLRFKEAVFDKVPAVVHSNYTGRLQTVKEEWNQRYYQLIRAFYEITDVPLLLNTSFNIMGKPIMHSVEDAIGLFYTTGLDALVLEDYLIEK